MAPKTLLENTACCLLGWPLFLSRNHTHISPAPLPTPWQCTHSLPFSVLSAPEADLCAPCPSPRLSCSLLLTRLAHLPPARVAASCLHSSAYSHSSYVRPPGVVPDLFCKPVPALPFGACGIPRWLAPMLLCPLGLPRPFPLPCK